MKPNTYREPENGRKLRCGIHQQMSILSMSPRNDVNRLGKLARGLGPHQYNIALDSMIGQKESVEPRN
jgi:hypothetical protein